MKTTILDSGYLRTNPEEGTRLLQDAGKLLHSMSGFYPGFKKWFDKKVTPGLEDGSRKIILAHANNRLAGVAIIKDTLLEQKLCCLRVSQDLQGSGLGLKLFDKSFEVLENDSPLLSVSEDNYDAFSKIFNHYGFEFVRAYDELYRPKKLELSFNGLLVPEHAIHHDLVLPKSLEIVD